MHVNTSELYNRIAQRRSCTPQIRSAWFLITFTNSRLVYIRTHAPINELPVARSRRPRRKWSRSDAGKLETQARGTEPDLSLRIFAQVSGSNIRRWFNSSRGCLRSTAI